MSDVRFIQSEQSEIVKQLIVTSLNEYRYRDKFIIPILTENELMDPGLDHEKLSKERHELIERLFTAMMDFHLKAHFNFAPPKNDTPTKYKNQKFVLTLDERGMSRVGVLLIKDHFLPDQKSNLLLLNAHEAKIHIIGQIDAYLKNNDPTAECFIDALSDEQAQECKKFISISDNQHQCNEFKNRENCPVCGAADDYKKISEINASFISGVIRGNQVVNAENQTETPRLTFSQNESDTRFDVVPYPCRLRFKLRNDRDFLLNFRNKLVDEVKLVDSKVENKVEEVKKAIDDVKNTMEANIQKTLSRKSLAPSNFSEKHAFSTYKKMYAQQEKDRRWKTGLAIAVSIFSGGLLALPAYLIWRNAKRKEVIQKIERPSDRFKQVREQRNRWIWKLRKLENKPKPHKEIVESVPGRTIVYLDKAKADRFRFYENRMKSHPFLFKILPFLDKRDVILSWEERERLTKLKEESGEFAIKLRA